MLVIPTRADEEGPPFGLLITLISVCDARGVGEILRRLRCLRMTGGGSEP
jgi:hypothetical protein